MQTLLCKDILNTTAGVLVSGSSDTKITGISTDSRKVVKGDLFIPICGEKYDGHDFIRNSIESGAAAVLTQKDIEPVEGTAVIKVNDTLRAMGDIAGYFRQKFRIPFVAITGSVGKTSTKDIVANVLSRKYNVLKTEGNLNTEIGLPLTIFNLDSSYEAAVIEMGMRGFGEIRYLASIAKPSVAVVTNIGMSHIERLGSRQNILKAKMEILEGLDKDGLVVLNGDDELLSGMKNILKFRTVFYGMDDDVDYQAFNIATIGEHSSRFDITVDGNDYTVQVPVPGIHNIYNALAAIAVGNEFKVPMQGIIDGIAAFSPGQMRMNIITVKGVKIINDAYNASPQSMEAAIGVLKDMGAGRRTIAVLGSMLEMGSWACSSHEEIGRYAVSRGIDHIVTVGEYGKMIADGAVEAGARPGSVLSFMDNDEAGTFLADFVRKGDVVLVKGSRRMKMEELVQKLTIGC